MPLVQGYSTPFLEGPDIWNWKIKQGQKRWRVITLFKHLHENIESHTYCLLKICLSNTK